MLLKTCQCGSNFTGEEWQTVCPACLQDFDKWIKTFTVSDEDIRSGAFDRWRSGLENDWATDPEQTDLITKGY